jgi:hypothetical protein
MNHGYDDKVGAIFGHICGKVMGAVKSMNFR